MKKWLLFLTLLMLNSLLNYAQQKFTLSGFVLEKGSEEKNCPTIIKINSTGSYITTNDYGFFSVSLAQGDYSLTVAFPGSVDTQYTVNVNSDVQLNLEIRTENELEGIEVVAAAKNAEQIRMSSHNLDVEQIKNVPSLWVKKMCSRC